MKTITNRAFFKPSLMLLLLMLPLGMIGQDALLTQTHTTDAMLAEAAECTANDLIVTELYLADKNGNPITSSCEPGTDQTAYIYAVFQENANANRYSLSISYELLLNEDESTRTFIQDCKFENAALPVEDDLLVQAINYKCGDRIELQNFYLRWHTSQGKSCSDAYSPSKCFFSAPGFVVNAPLVTNFEFNNPCNSYIVQFTDKTTGGDIENPYTYSWNFGDGGTSNLPNPNHVYDNPGMYNVTLTVTDSEGAMDSQMWPVTIYPVLDGLTLTPTEIDCNGDTNGSITASGVTGGNGAYTYSINPEPAGFSQNDNVFSNLPSGNYTVTVTDERNCTISASTTINVGDSTDPTISAPANLDVSACNTSEIMKDGSTNLPFSSVESEITVDQFTQEGGLYTEENVKTITYIDSASGTCPILVTRTFTITDDCDRMASDSQTISLFDKDAPQVPAAPVNVTVQCITDVPAAANLEADDECDGTVAGVVNDVTDDTDPCNVIITRTWTFTDSCDNESSVSQIITVSDTTAPDAPNNPASQDYQCLADVPAPGNLIATDNCDGNIEVTGVDSIDDADTCNIVITRTWTFIDSCDNSSTTTQTINVSDTTDPVLTSGASNIEISCDGDDNDGALQAWLDSNGGATATDNCGVINWTNNYGNVASDCSDAIEVTFTATDNCNNSVSTTATYAVVDNQSPTITTAASDLTVECDGGGNTTDLDSWLDNNGGAVATDDCSAVAWSHNFTGLSDDCGATGSATVTFTAIDGCGNTSETTATFTIEDTIAPVAPDAPADITVECSDDVPSAANLNANDNCDGVVAGVPSDSTDDSDPCKVVITRTWTFTDSCGNDSTVSQTITVSDTLAPVAPAAPADVTVECTDDVPTAADLNANDNCDGVVAGVPSDSTDNTDPCNVVITRTWTFTDSCDNESSVSQIITVSDTTAPVAPAAPANLTVECIEDVPVASDLDATDNCDGVVAGVPSDSTDNTDPCNVVITRTWTFTDSCDNESSVSQIITVSDTTDPVINTPASNIDISCSGDDNDGALQAWLDNNGGATATDNCGTVTWSNNYGSVSSDCSEAIEVIFTATDNCGNSTTTSATYAVVDTNNPIITTEASDETVECDGEGNTAALQAWLDSNGGAVATDDCSAVAWSNDFSGLSDDCGATGSATVTFTAIDGCGNTSETTATFTIEDSTAPVITNEAGNTNVECDGAGNVADYQAFLDSNGGATAEDSCSEVSWSYIEEPITEGCGNTFFLKVTFVASDECGNESRTIGGFFVIDTTPPVITEAQDMTVECGDDVEAAYNNWIASNGGATASDSCSDIIYWSADESAGFSDECGQTGSITVTFTASDDCSKIASTTATFTIEDTTPPVIETEASNTNIECSGDDNSNELQTWLDNNGGAMASDNCGTVTWSNDYGQTDVDNCSGAVTVTFTATDECGNTSTTSATYSLSDTVPPTIDTEATSVTVECTGDGNEADLMDFLNSNGGAVASDDCSAVSWSHDFNGLSDDCGLTGSATVTFTAKDGCGNTSSTTATFTIQDTTPPTISGAQDGSAECGSDPEAALQAWIDNNGGATASDDCSETFTWSSEVSELSDACGETGSYTVTFTAMDECGNTATTSAVFQIIDTVAPSFTVPESVTVECDDDLTDLTLTGEVTAVADDCSTEFEISYVDTINEGECAGTYTIIRTWTVADNCGNESNQDQTLSVVDTTGPTFTVPESVTIECSEDENDLSLTGEPSNLEDNCSTEITTSYVDSETAGGCPSERIITRTWTAMDECGNTTSMTQTITVADTTAPVILGDLEPQLSVSCSDIPEVPSLIFEDACTTEIEVEFNETSTDDSEDVYTITRVWTATDECGNSNTFTQTITVNNTPSTIPSALGDICSDAEAFDVFTIIGSNVPTDGTFTVNSGNFDPNNGTLVNPTNLTIDQLYSFTYRVNDGDEACATEYEISFTIIECIVLPPPPTECIPEISQAVTPNGDGINEAFEVDIDPTCGFTVQLMIFNRWGAKIYESDNYNGEWNAQASDKSIGSANKVPTGTYYYIINLINSDLPPLSGPIYVGTK